MSIDWTKVITPEMKFEAAKEQKRSLLSSAFKRYVLGSFICSLGFPMQFSEADSLKMEGAIKLLESQSSTGGYLTDANDVTHYDVPVCDIKAVQLEMLAHFAAAHAKKQQMRAQVDNAATQEELDAIVLDFENIKEAI